MAKITGVYTGWRGKVGNIVYAMWNGVQVAKTRVIPANPQTSLQQSNRGCFRKIVQTFKVLAVDFIRPFWNTFAAPGKSGWGNFISANKLAMGSVFDIENAVFSTGDLSNISNVSAIYNSVSGQLDVSWNGSLYGISSNSDYVSFIIYNKDLKQIVAYSICSAIREDESFLFNLLSGYSATALYVFYLTSVGSSYENNISMVSNSNFVIASTP